MQKLFVYLLSLGHLSVDFAPGALPAILPFFKKPLGLCWAVTGVFRIFACQMEDSHDKTRKTG